ncbi:transcription cofactor HES-6-like [Clarias gariepinus]|uniref:transcription cofactor HES-6-like n=1 Tax=Clarias gariepinus TaxID=13013 RepID=UPI00234DC1B6|nr:transcription cofactor HES-6-like [Clarias gariepinus]
MCKSISIYKLKLHAKMENAEVLELMVRRVESILQDRSHETDSMSREASERFASGYIQCMHEIHTFVSMCPGIESTVAAELLNHLLECMPLLKDLQDVIIDLGSELLSPTGTWPRIGVRLSLSASTNGAEEDPSSDLQETFSSESAPGSAAEEEQEEEEEEEEQEDQSIGASSPLLYIHDREPQTHWKQRGFKLELTLSTQDKSSKDAEGHCFIHTYRLKL